MSANKQLIICKTTDRNREEVGNNLCKSYV